MVEVYIRHGQYSHEADRSLTQEGIQQTKAAAKYLQDNFPEGFDVAIHSERRRAAHTAEVLDLSRATWEVDARLNEATWPLPWPTEFSPYREFYGRVSGFCRDLDERQSSGSRLIVSHGGTMQMVRAYREGFVDARFQLLQEEPYRYFTNCQLIIYTDIDLVTGVADSGRRWVKSVCPWNQDRTRSLGHDWLEVVR